MVVVRAGRAIGTVLVLVLTLVRATAIVVVAAAAFIALRLGVDVVHREYTTEDSGVYAEDHQPCEPCAHDAEETRNIPFCKSKGRAGASQIPLSMDGSTAEHGRHARRRAA